MVNRIRFLILFAFVAAACHPPPCPNSQTLGTRKSAAIGALTSVGDGRTVAITLLDTTTATNGPPSGASAGLATSTISSYFGGIPDPMTLAVVSTAGSGTMTATIKLWCYLPVDSGKWVPLGTGGDTTKGTINAGAALGETTADSIVHSEPFQLTGTCERYYAEVTAIGGTATAVKVYLIGRQGAY